MRKNTVKSSSSSYEVSFIVLTYNSERYIINCIDSIGTLYPNVNLELIVIDNGSVDKSLQLLIGAKRTKKFPITIIPLPKNIGTTKSRNIGIKKADGQYVVIMDSDIEFIGKSFSQMLSYLKQHHDIGILVPKIAYPNGHIQHSCKKFPTFPAKLLKLMKIFTRFDFIDQDFYDNFPFNSCREVDTAISAFWLFRKNLIDLVGYLDENIFYSPEDVDFCIRVWLTGKKVVFYPRFEIIHHCQQISHKMPFDKISRSHLKGLIYYFSKYHYWVNYKKIRHLVDRRISH